jgi:hypothetical protein
MIVHVDLDKIDEVAYFNVDKRSMNKYIVISYITSCHLLYRSKIVGDIL